MLVLEEKHIIGQGKDRVCYMHPDDSDKCVKIIKVNHSHKQSIREHSYYRFMKRKNKDMRFLSRYYGKLNTNLGSGLVFELCKDSDIKISKSIDYYFENNLYIESLSIIDNLKRLRENLIDNSIIFTDLSPYNILYKTDTKTIMVIDGIGNYDFIKISNYFEILAKNKINRRFDRFEKHLFEKYPHNKVVQNILV